MSEIHALEMVFRVLNPQKGELLNLVLLLFDACNVEQGGC